METYIEVPLTRGLVALIDVVDAELVRQHKWNAHDPGGRGTYYAFTGVWKPNGKRSTVAMHSMLTGWPLVDHANANGLDNRRANLRPATTAQNQFNVRKSRGASQFKGVHRKRARWCARIKRDGRQRFLGSFVDEAEAARAYDAAARELFGEYARLNFPD